MAIPTVKVLLLPTLKCLEDRSEVPHTELIRRVAERVGLSDADLTEMNSSGKQRKIYERVTWAVVHMRKAGLVRAASRGVTAITERGLDFLAENPATLDYRVLKDRYPEYLEFDKLAQQRRKERLSQIGPSPAAGTPANVTPTGVARKVQSVRHGQSPTELEHSLSNNIKALDDALEKAIASRISNMEVEQLGNIVLALLSKMGYGDGARDVDAKQSLSSGTTIRNALGLNQVFARVTADGRADVQELQAFTSAFDAAHAERGILVSTGGFSVEARGYALGSAKRIQIVDATDLARLMLTHEVGIVIHASHTVKRIDKSYFERLQAVET